MKHREKHASVFVANSIRAEDCMATIGVSVELPETLKNSPRHKTILSILRAGAEKICNDLMSEIDLQADESGDRMDSIFEEFSIKTYQED